MENLEHFLLLLNIATATVAFYQTLSRRKALPPRPMKNVCKKDFNIANGIKKYRKPRQRGFFIVIRYLP